MHDYHLRFISHLEAQGSEIFQPCYLYKQIYLRFFNYNIPCDSRAQYSQYNNEVNTITARYHVTAKDNIYIKINALKNSLFFNMCILINLGYDSSPSHIRWIRSVWLSWIFAFGQVKYTYYVVLKVYVEDKSISQPRS